MFDSIDFVLKALKAGCADLFRNAALLDCINVFPVMDGDTGANLRATLSLVQEMDDVGGDIGPASLAPLLAAPLLRAARGNSGIILAEFLAGFAIHVADTGRLDYPVFRSALSNGRDRAYRAVSRPREGTMLTVMTALVDALPVSPARFTLADHAALEARLSDAVLSTPSQLPVLAEAGVVDAGALGFFFVGAGVTLALPILFAEVAAFDAIERRIAGRQGAPALDIGRHISPKFAAAARAAGAGERYCVNLVVRAPGDAPMAETLGPLGTSLNIARIDGIAKIHVHTDAPEAVLSAAATLGAVEERVVQDMQRSLRASAPGRGAPAPAFLPVRVVADSALSLGFETLDATGILRIDNDINVAGRMISDRDVDRDRLLAEMRAGAGFTTAQVSPEAVASFLDAALACSGHVVFVAVGRAYTGTQETVLRVAAGHPERARITVLDSAAASGQQGLVCLATQRFAAAGNPAAAVVDYARAQIRGCREYLFIPDLTYLKRSGRIGSVAAAFASVLSIKPIVGHGPEGAVTVAKVRSESAAVADIAARVRRHPGRGPLLVLVEHTDNRPFAEALKARFLADADADRGVEVVLAPLSASSVVHMGPGTWGVAVTRLGSSQDPQQE